MKKFLSLVMALIMVMSLVTVASAADYTDAADVDKAEAVEVMSAVGVFQGSAGKFNPKGILNRAEAAKLIAYLDLGEKTAEALPAVKAFSDVPETHWAAKYIAYCADAGYINGVGNGKFDPAGKLTGYQFGKLVLCVLGYDATIESFTGANWSIAVAKLMKSNDINKGVKAAPSAELTREDAAQYCLNALKATTVDYESKGTNITINGVVIATGASKAEAVYDTAAAGANAIVVGTPIAGPKYTVELGEKLYEGDLELDDNATDDFGRVSNEWTYKNDTVGTYAETADFTFTVDTSASKVAKALKGIKDQKGYKVEDDTKIAVYGNKTSAKVISNLTDNGKLVEVFVNSDNEITSIVEIPYNVGEVTKVSTNTKTGDVTYTITGAGSLIDYADEDKTDTIVLAGAIAKGDYVTYVKPAGCAKTYVYPTTVKEGVVSKAANADYIVLDGVEYPQSASVAADKDAQKVWIDQYGVVVRGEKVDSTTEYVYVTSKWTESNKSDTANAWYAQIVTAEGEVKELKVKDQATHNNITANTVITYTTDSGKINGVTTVASGEVVPLVATASNAASTIKEGAAKLTAANTAGNPYFFADDVTFVYMNKSGDDLKVTTSKSVDKVATIPANSFAILDEGEVVAVFIRAKAAASTKGNDLLFMADTDIQGNYVNKDNAKVNTYEFYLNGEKDEYGIKSGSPAVGYFEYAVDQTTGDLELTAKNDDVFVVTVDLNGSGEVYAINKDTYVKLGDPLSGTPVNDDIALADDAVIYDTTGNDIVSLADIVNVVEDDVNVSSLTLYVIYDSKNENISMIYVAD